MRRARWGRLTGFVEDDSEGARDWQWMFRGGGESLGYEGNRRRRSGDSFGEFVVADRRGRFWRKLE